MDLSFQVYYYLLLTTQRRDVPKFSSKSTRADFQFFMAGRKISLFAV